MESLNKLHDQFSVNTQTAVYLCEKMEIGQAETPLKDLFSSISGDLANAPFSLTLLCLNPQIKQSVLKWLYGLDFAVFSFEVSKQIGLLQIQLKDKGYSLQKSSGERFEFDQWNQLLDAIVDSNVMQLENESAINLQASSDTNIKNIQVLMPENSVFIEQSPALLTKLTQTSNVLILAAPLEYQLSKTDRRVIDSLQDEMSCFWALIPVDELKEGIEMPDKGWWAYPKIDCSLSPQIITTHVKSELPDFLTDASHPIRQSLNLLHLGKRSLLAVEAIDDRNEQEITRLNSRKKRMKRQDISAQQAPLNSLSAQNNELMSLITEQIRHISGKLNEANRKRELSNSAFNQWLNGCVKQLTAKDLNQTKDYKHFKLSLNDNFVQQVTQELNQQLKKHLSEDLNKLAEYSDGLEQTIKDQLQSFLDYTPLLTAKPAERNQFWQELKQSVVIDLNYQGELPKRNLLDRISEGRRAAFVILMSASLLGYMGINVRDSAWLGILILPVFIFSIFYTFRSWKQQDQVRLDKELIKIREEIKRSVKRIMSDINRHKSNLIGEFLEQQKKAWQQQIEPLLTEKADRTQQTQNQQQQQAKSRIGLIDEQIQDKSHLQKPIKQLQKTVKKLQQQCQQWLVKQL